MPITDTLLSLIHDDGYSTGEASIFQRVAVDGDTVMVSSKEVAKPVDVRFAWSNDAVPNFFNKAGLPASPFRTDDEPYSTVKRGYK